MSIILFVMFFLFMAIGVPIAFAIGVAGLLVVLFFSDGLTLSFLVSKLFDGLDSFVIAAVPFYVLAGNIMSKGGLIHSIVRFAQSLIGHVRGGTAQVTTLSSMVFAGVSGSAVADAAGIGSILIPAMREQGYDKDFCVAVTASSSTIGPIIPPSIVMVVYASVANVSIGQMFLGGIVPGILVGLAIMVVNYLICVKRGYNQTSERAKLGVILRCFKESIPALMVPIIIIGGIVSGIFTATEAGVIAVVYALVIALFVTGTVGFKQLPDIFLDSAATTTVVLMVMGMSNVFAQILMRDLFNNKVYTFLTGISSSPYVILFIILGFLTMLGFFVDTSAMIILFGGIFSTIATGLGFDPIHFGVVMVMTCLIATVTPPVGTLLFVTSSIAKVNLAEATRVIWPYVLILFVVCVICALFPALVTFIPSRVM